MQAASAYRSGVIQATLYHSSERCYQRSLHARASPSRVRHPHEPPPRVIGRRPYSLPILDRGCLGARSNQSPKATAIHLAFRKSCPAHGVHFNLCCRRYGVKSRCPAPISQLRRSAEPRSPGGRVALCPDGQRPPLTKGCLRCPSRECGLCPPCRESAGCSPTTV